MKKILVSLTVVCLFAQIISAVSLSIYNDNLALVKQIKDFNLSKGVQKIETDDIPAGIDTASVLPKFLTDSDKIKIYEQNYDFDLISQEKLLEKYIGKNIELERPAERKPLEVKLLSAKSEGKIFQFEDKIMINPYGQINLPKLSEGLILKPTLSWIVDSQVAGKKQMQIIYQTKGISWAADYIIVLDKNEKNFDMNSWVTINNLSGASYNQADLKLIAGDVKIINERQSPNIRTDNFMQMKASASFESFQEKSFFEYHIYELKRKTTIKQNEKKQIEFASAQAVPSEKIYTYNSSQIDYFDFNVYRRTEKNFYTKSNTNVNVNIKFKNDKSSKLGIALPKGRARVYKDDGQSMEFVGEDYINHVSEDEIVLLNIGNAFDITGERTQTDFKTGDKYVRETFEIKIINSKPENVEIYVVEPMGRWSSWNILSSSLKYDKKDSKTITFNLKVPAKSQKTFTYTVEYTW